MQRFDVLDRTLSILGHHFLEASAGTGKTFAIEHIVTRLLIETEPAFEMREILIVTFTKAATRELTARIRKNLLRTAHMLRVQDTSIDYLKQICEQGPAAVRAALKKIEAALIHFDQAAIFTLHGFCYRALKEHALEADAHLQFSDPDKNGHVPIVKKITHEYLTEHLKFPKYSAFQIQLLLKKHKGDYRKLKNFLANKVLSGKKIAPLASFEELHRTFLVHLAALPSIHCAHWTEDLERLLPHYKRMTSSQIPEQIQQLGRILEKRECTLLEFEALCKYDLFLEGMEPSNLKARAKLPTDESLHYPGLYEQTRRTVLSPLLEAKDPVKVQYAVAKDLIEACAPLIEKKECFFPDMLLTKVEKALQFPAFVEKLKKKYRAVIIDEFQDTDPIQWNIVEKLFLGSVEALYLVGDPKQSIYAFRNADVYTYLNAAERLGESAKKHLDRNFRSRPSLVQSLNAFFSKTVSGWMPLPGINAALSVPEVRYVENGEAFDPGALTFFVAEGPSGRGGSFPTAEIQEKKIFPFISSKIIELHREKKLPLHDCAILVKDRFEAKKVMEHLKTRGIPSHFKRGSQLTEGAAYLALKEIVETVLFTEDLGKLKRALGSILIGWNEIDLKKGIQDPQILHAKGAIKKLQRILFDEGFAAFFQALLHTSFIPKHIQNLGVCQGGSPNFSASASSGVHRHTTCAGGEIWDKADAGKNQILNVFGHTSSTLLEYLLKTQPLSVYNDLRKLAELLIEEQIHRGLNADQLYAFLVEMEESAQQDENRFRAPSSEETGSVVIMTTHVSKGLEFDTVFALGIATRHRSPDEMTLKATTTVIPFDSAHPDAQLALEELDAEKMRQLYVAMTRAKERLFVAIAIDSEKKEVERGAASPMELFLAKCITASDPYASFLDLPKIQLVLDDMSYQVLSPSEDMTLLSSEMPENVSLTIQNFTYPRSEEKMHSFSSIHKAVQGVHKETKAPASGMSIHAMPLGSDTGVILHAIFEEIFKNNWHNPLDTTQINRYIQKKVKETCLEKFHPLLLPWICDLLTAKIGSFALVDVLPSHFFQEMEFCFDIDQGAMTGFCDLVFVHEGKYYLLDWKSNFLGPADEDYTIENIEAAMQEHGYFLQASIYKEALQRYVKLFDSRPFDEIFGGAIYYFVRGRAVYHFQPAEFKCTGLF